MWFSLTYAAIIADFGLDVYRRAFLYHRLQNLLDPGAEVGPGAPGVGDVLLAQGGQDAVGSPGSENRLKPRLQRAQ